MPKGKTKKFIDKKKSVTFHLVHRSQQDPLAADETAPQRVLVPAEDTQAAKLEKKPVDFKKRKEEQEKYGIFFDDDYDYLQHLRDVNAVSVDWETVENPNDDKGPKDEKPKINLPSSVFASNVEEDVGLLNKAAPVSGLRLDLDPDIVAAMDDDFDYDDPENQLEDDFMQLANDEESSENELFTTNEMHEYDSDESDKEDAEENSDVSSNDHMAVSDEERDEVASLNGPLYSFDDEETKSRFTEYSMSSSIIKRTEQLTLLDDKFERMYAGYDDCEIGALDCDEIEGYVDPDSELILQYVKEYEVQKNQDTENMSKLMKDRVKIIDGGYSSSEDEEKLEKLIIGVRDKDTWDCESVLSTYSNIYNHPKLITEPKGLGRIRVDPKTGIPKDVLDGPTGKLTAKSLARLDLENQVQTPEDSQSVANTVKSTLSILSVRPKNETPEERKERKKALKEYRKERRIERKANTEAFKEEKKRQEKMILNNNKNIQGNRIL